MVYSDSKDDCGFLTASHSIAFSTSIKKDIPQFVNLEKENIQFVQSNSMEDHIALLGDSDCMHLSIFKLPSITLVGYMMLFGLNRADKSIELRRIVIDQKGLGFGRESLKLIVIYCFEQLHAQTLWLDVYADNDRAIYLYESLGFKKYDTMDIQGLQGKKSRKVHFYRIVKNSSK